MVGHFVVLESLVYMDENGIETFLIEFMEAPRGALG
jgi:hypothetical protein